MFYQLNQTHMFNGSTDYLDISDTLHYFLQTDQLGLRVSFETSSPGYSCLLAVYYKESLLPDFGIYLNKGYPAVITRQGGRQLVYTADRACNDGQRHQLVFNGNQQGITLWLDGQEVVRDSAIVPYCDYQYVGFATIGRSTLRNQYDSFFQGAIHSLELDTEALTPTVTAQPGLTPYPLFARGMLESENFRIPALITTPKGTVIATADARLDAPGDNPNHIGRAVRVSHDSGATWSPPQLVLDHGGLGRAEGAAAIDAGLVCDRETGRVYMFYGHTPAGIGSVRSQAGTGFDEKGRQRLWDQQNALHLVEADGRVVTQAGEPTPYTVDAVGHLFVDGQPAGSICHGQDRLLREEDTTFLQYLYSDDEGDTWQGPVHLNHSVKEPWMGFLGPGPGCGIQIEAGAFAGRMLMPVYYQSRESQLYSCAVVYSDDHGQSWQLGQAVSQGRLFEGEQIDPRASANPRAVTSESQVVELEGGVVKIFMRSTFAGRVATAISDDGGRSWHSYALDDALLDPNCQCAILRANHAGQPCWLFSNPQHTSLRVGGRVHYSNNQTCGWQHSRLIDAGEYGYSCMTQLPDGQIGLLYEGLDIAQLFVKFPIEWLVQA